MQRSAGLLISACLIGAICQSPSSFAAKFAGERGVNEVEAGSAEWLHNCTKNSKSFDSDPGHYLGYNGEHHQCSLAGAETADDNRAQLDVGNRSAEPETPPLRAETTAGVNVRAGPGAKFALVGSLASNVLVNVRFCKSRWCNIDSQGGSAWVSEAYLLPTPSIAFDFRPREVQTVAVRPDGTIVPHSRPSEGQSESLLDRPSSGWPVTMNSVLAANRGEPLLRSTHGDWEMRCDTVADSQNEHCVIMQWVTATDRAKAELIVLLLNNPADDTRFMRVLAPLGTLMTSGLGLSIDGTDLGRAEFGRCLPIGCVAEVILEDDLLSSLSNGKTATFIIFQTPEDGFGIPISLDGLAAGYSKLP